MSSLIWVAVPQRVADDEAHLAVLVVPRLGKGRVEDWGLRNWPGLLSEMRFEVRRRDRGQVTTDLSARLTSTPDSQVWEAFFAGAAGDIVDETPRAPQQLEVEDTYPDALRAKETHRALARRLAADGRAADLHPDLRPWTQQPRRVGVPDDGRPAPRPPTDFARTVTLLREHPRVLRALGLIFDLSVDRSFLDGADPDTSSVLVTSADSPVRIEAPWTRYRLHNAKFRPADPTSSAHRAGVLDLRSTVPLADLRLLPDGGTPPAPSWLISTFDVDATIGHLQESAETLRRGERVIIPRARSGGLSLIRPGRADDHRRLAARLASRAADVSDTELTADDLIIGYRVDIRRGGEPWRSVCERYADYVIERPDGRPLVIGNPGVEEGQVRPRSMLRRGDGPLTADQTVLRWDGWSLVLPPPTAGRRRSPADLPYQLSWTFDVPRDGTGAPAGRLPALRFAERYRLRARVADVTGGGPSLAEADIEDGATPTVVYTRAEAVEPPQLNAADPPTLGATADVLVVSSDPDDDQPTITRRSLLPPTGSFRLAEQHRVFDNPAGLALAEKSFESALRNEPVSLPDPAAEGVFAYAPAEPGGLSEPWEGESQWPGWPVVEPKTVELIGHADAGAARLEFTNERLTVQLPPAEQIVVELSSSIRDDFLDHFTLRDWITGPDAPLAWSSMALRGRHPLLSPVRRLTFVHVVRRPLVAPHWQLPAAPPDRSPGDTSVLLAPRFTAGDLDTDSTSRLEIHGTWTDMSDCGARPSSNVKVHATTVDRGTPQVAAFRHEFGDTKHRRITYTLTAISRFRHFFPDNEPDERFHRSQVQPATVNILSSQRPPQPSVQATIPAFAWTTTTTPTMIVNERRVLIRVELSRPWFCTGDGELLAVLLAPPGTTGSDDLPVTCLGRDPIHAGDPLPSHPPASWFSGTAGPAHPVELSATDNTLVVAVPYQVHDTGTHWSADIALDIPDTIDTYGPFVRLAVARYQPDSIPGHRLSEPAVCDPVTLLPDRTNVVELTPDGVRVTLSGRGPRTPTTVEAVLEELDRAHDPTEVDLIALHEGARSTAWHRISDTRTVGAVGAPLPLITSLSSPGHLRLLVREIDPIPTDPAADGPRELSERTSFVDIIAVPDAWRRPS